jgi:hypothetical protein
MIINSGLKFWSLFFATWSTLGFCQCTVKHPASDVIKTEKSPRIKEQKEIEELPLIYDNLSYSDKVKTIRLHKKDWEQGDPVIILGSTDQLELRFDVLGGQLTNYQYRIIHCNRNWEQSNLGEMEYLDGFNDNYIEFHQYSFNALQNYVHYAQYFPNDLVRLTKSGNYMLIVYPEGNFEQPLFTRRFYVSEETASVKTHIKFPSNIEDRYYKHEIDFDIFFNPSDVFNPYDNIKVDLEQNHRHDNGIYDLAPNFIRDNQMTYNYDEQNVMEAGNEFRHLDLTTTRTRTAQVYKFETINDTINALVMNDLNRQYQKYLQYGDINGRYVIKSIDGNNFHQESQYVNVRFTLPYPEPLASGDIFIFGELSDWKIKNEFRMRYDYSIKAYRATLFLKQGYYNYAYLYAGDANRAGLMSKIEGTHFDTENEYIFRVYYSDPQQAYDRLLGYHIANSRENF